MDSAARRPDTALQLIGDGLATALAQHIPGAEDLAAECVRQLRERDWDGDVELADQLDGQLGVGPPSLLRPLPIDLEELAAVLEGDPLTDKARIDLRTGEVWPWSAIEYAVETGDLNAADFDEDDNSGDPERWLPVDNLGSGDGYRDMLDFIDTVANANLTGRLDAAVRGRGAFRRFKDVLVSWPAERERWYAFSDDRHRGRARAWLTDAGYRTSPPGHPHPDP